MSDIVEKLRGNAPLLFDDRIASADEIKRLREWQRRAANLLPLVPRVSGSDLSCEVALLMAIERTAVQPTAAPRWLKLHNAENGHWDTDAGNCAPGCPACAADPTLVVDRSNSLPLSSEERAKQWSDANAKGKT